MKVWVKCELDGDLDRAVSLIKKGMGSKQAPISTAPYSEKWYVCEFGVADEGDRFMACYHLSLEFTSRRMRYRPPLAYE